MRHTLVIGLTLLVSAVAVGADKPIPQDTARIEKRHRERLEWNRRTVVGVYDKVGKRDPRWNEQALKALELTARMFAEEVDPEITPVDVSPSAKAAVEAGCDDPYLVYIYNRTLGGADFPGEEEAIRRAQVWAKALAASRYPAFRRANALELAGRWALSVKVPSEAARKGAERNYDATLALLPESVATDEHTEFWEDRWFDTLSQLIAGYRKLGLAAPAAYERVDAGLAKLPELKVLRLLVRGNFWYHYGWEARTTAFAPNVPKGGFETLEKCVDKAREAFNEAWRLRPDDARAASNLLDIEKTAGGDRDTMEQWFDRAMKADGDRLDACFSKLDWLDPKWHGSVEEMLAFGHACAATKNWRVGITVLAADAHFRVASMLAPEDRMKYLSSPQVWSEIKSVLDEYLMHHPSMDPVRSKYAALCYLAGHYREAHAQFKTLGDRLTTWYTFPNIPLETLKSMRDKAAARQNDDAKPAK